MRRLEREWLEKERQSLKELETSQTIEADVETISAKAETEIRAEPQEAENPDCSGPSARFKASCR